MTISLKTKKPKVRYTFLLFFYISLFTFHPVMLTVSEMRITSVIESKINNPLTNRAFNVKQQTKSKNVYGVTVKIKKKKIEQQH